MALIQADFFLQIFDAHRNRQRHHSDRQGGFPRYGQTGKETL